MTSRENQRLDLPADYRLVPPAEIQRRLSGLQQLLGENGYGAALFLQNIDIYYLSGTMQNGILLLPAAGKPVFWVRRSWRRALAESPLPDIRPLTSLEEVAAAASRLLSAEKRLGLELDVIPAKIMQKYQALLPAASFTDVSPLVRRLRAVKSPYEIDCITRACRASDRVMARVPDLLTAGGSEIELQIELEREARRQGHWGLARMRGWNSEMAFGHILSGPAAALPGYMDAPTNGLGPGPALPQGASRQPLRPGQPVSVDFMINIDGYLSDCTRMFCLGEPPAAIARAHERLQQLLRQVTAPLRPGMAAGEIFRLSLALATELGYGENYLGCGRDRVAFFGHGVGLEVDEFPFFSRRNPETLETNMVFALEPKFIFPGLGLAAIENTYRLARDGARQLTVFPEEIQLVNP